MPCNAQKERSRWTRARVAICGAGLLCLAGLSGCRSQEDAAATAAQLSATATELGMYYGALGNRVDRTVELYEIDAALTGVPFAADDRKQMEAVRTELEKRRAVAGNLAALGSALTALTASRAPVEVEAASTALGNSLIEAHALSSTSDVPTDLGTAGNALLQLVKAHEERKAAKAMDGTLRALAEVFAKEQPVYDSLGRTYWREAGQIATELTGKGQVDVAQLLRPALRPFDLVPLPGSQASSETLRALAQAHTQAEIQHGVQAQTEASEAMLQALREVGAEVHAVADGKRVLARTPPASLQVVNLWVANAAVEGGATP